MTSIDWSGQNCSLAPRKNSQVYDLAKDLFVAEGGNKPPHRCINDACLFIQEWQAFLGMDSASPQGSGNLPGES